jgi:hypothetical protein
MKMLKILEVSWMIIALAAFGIATWKWVTEGFNQAIFIYGIAVIASVFCFIRRKQRLSMEKQNAAR